MISKKSLIVKGKWLTALGIVMMLLCVYGATGVFQFSTSGGVDNFDLLTKIVCSNGNVYEATFANLQTALNSSGCTEVRVPACNITFTSTLWVPSGVWLHGVGNGTVFYLGDNVNKTMIRIVNYSKNVHISDIRLEGNGLNQPEWWRINAHYFSYAHGIVAKASRHVKITDVIVNNTHSSGIFLAQCWYSTVANCKTMNTGKLYRDSGSGYIHWFAKGIAFSNCSYSSASNLYINYSYSCGFVLENYDVTGTDYKWFQSNMVVNNVVVEDGGGYGVYLERVRDSVLSNIISSKCTNTVVYGAAAGFYTNGVSTYDVSFIGCEANNNAHGFSVTGKDINLIGCKSSNNTGNGFISYTGRNLFYLGCKSSNDGSRGFFSSSLNTSIVSCDVSNSGTDGICVSIVAGARKNNSFTKVHSCTVAKTLGGDAIVIYADNFSVIGNTISNPTGDGIEINAGNRGIVSDNTIYNVSSRGIYLTTGSMITVSGNIITGGGYYNSAIFTSSINSTFSNNIVNQIALHYPEEGIKESSPGNWSRIDSDNIFNTAVPILLSGTKTWAMLVNSTTRMIGIFTKSGTTWK